MVCAAKLTAQTLREKSKSDLEKQLYDLKKELAGHRVSKVTGGSASQLSQIRVTRKNIARVLTVVTANQRSNLKSYYAKKKYMPTDLRAKRTHAIRQALSHTLATKQTVKQTKKNQAFPTRKFALKA
ncbi:hypothetical protein PROFUN_09751 [Planoprotostelium fungivorum]|uniref:60S ribosomal protein L35 n=1 Tax=Planoprotostelium fungivorum TaxID=1890364 RepID=A0A2P6NFA3_9EUKA|nr:hypothetical protein PROFUN_09751 [Planoprotostelium fungivorum]